MDDRSWRALGRSEVVRARAARIIEPSQKALDDAKVALKRISERLEELRRARARRRAAK